MPGKSSKTTLVTIRVPNGLLAEWQTDAGAINQSVAKHILELAWYAWRIKAERPRAAQEPAGQEPAGLFDFPEQTAAPTTPFRVTETTKQRLERHIDEHRRAAREAAENKGQ